MRKSVITAGPGKQVVKSFPAPVGGMNVRDPIGQIPPTDAYNLINWIPQHYGIRVRKGYQNWATGFGAPVQTVMQYFPSNATISPTINFASTPTTLPGKVFAATDNYIYDITSQNPIGASVKTLSGNLYAGILQTNMFVNSGGSFLMCCSEIDGYFYYDGTNWVVPSMGTGAGQVNGVDPTKLCFNLPWHHRNWFIERGTSHVWYSATDSITGTFSLFDVGPLFKHGGGVNIIANWTIDAGTGLDDLLVIVGDNGDVLIYKGTDPSSASTFALIGQFYVGEMPKGRRGLAQFGGDLLILSKLGIVPMSYVTRGGAEFLAASDGEYTSKIQALINEDLPVSINLYGWEMLLHPTENVLIIATPNQNGVVNKQYVMNTNNNAWCLFNNMPIFTMCLCSGIMLFGTGDGRVCVGFNQYFDNLAIGATVGDAVQAYFQSCFSYFDNPGAMKHFLMVRPTFLAEVPPAVTASINTDFSGTFPGYTPTYLTSSASLWDAAKWDISAWGGGVNTYQSWQGASGIGYLGSLAMLTLTAADTKLTAIDFMMEVGGPM